MPVKEGTIGKKRQERHMDMMEPLYDRANKVCLDKNQMHLQRIEEWLK